MIEVRGLVKNYGDVRAVDDVDLTIEAGEVFGLVGPNGAGKTTTFKVLSTLSRPDEGEVLINGLDARRKIPEVRRCLGFMPDHFGGYDSFRVTEYLDYFGALYGMPRAERRSRGEWVLELTDLVGKEESAVRALSKGMKQRLCLAKTLLGDPKVLVLDEPASGLDPRARVEMRSLLSELRSMGKTLILSSHILPELESLCDRVGFMEAGKMVATGTLAEIGASLRRPTTFRVRVRENQPGALKMLESLDGVLQVEEQMDSGGPFLRVHPAPAMATDGRVLRALAESEFQVTLFMEESFDLEDLFLQVTHGEVS